MQLSIFRIIVISAHLLYAAATPPSAAHAADFFVAEDGSDENTGFTVSSAFATISRGAAALTNPGDRVIVETGRYDDGDISPARGGGLGEPVVIMADTGGLFFGRRGAVVVRVPDGVGTGFIVIGQSGVVIDGFEIVGGEDAGVQVRSARDSTDSSDITIRDCAISRSARRGIDVTAVGAVTLTANTIANNGTGGVSVEGAEQGPVRPLIANNVIEDNGVSGSGHGIFIRDATDGLLQNNRITGSGLTGITIRNAQDIQVVNNLVVDNGVDCAQGRICGHGIALGTGGEPVIDAAIANNTSYGNHGWGLLFGGDDPPSRGAMAINNIFAENSLGGIAVSRESTCGYVAGFNLNPNGYGPDTPANIYDLDADPGFVDAGGRDFRLRVSGPDGPSAAIDAGSASAVELGITGSATLGSAADSGAIDLGFHAGASVLQTPQLERPLMPLFVTVFGDNRAGGTDPSTALASIREAADRAAAGVTVVVGPGRYDENDISPEPRAGVVAFLADTSGALTLDDPGVVLVDADANGPGFLLVGACESVIDGFHIRGGESGIQIRDGSDRAWVTNNVIFSADNRGVDVFSTTDARITNNLIYDCNGGIQVLDSPLTVIAANTIFGHAFNGVFLQGESPCARVRYNIIEDNLERGLLVRSTPQIVEWNLNSSGYLGIERPPTDRNDAAALLDPDGADDVLGGRGFADDRFDLGTGSPAIDLIPLAAADTELGDRSTTLDGRPDRGRLDAGYHRRVDVSDPRSRPRESAFADDEDLEVCDELIANQQPTPGPGGAGSGGGCAILPTHSANGAPFPILLVGAVLILRLLRRPKDCATRA